MKSQLRVASHAPNAIDKNYHNTLFLENDFLSHVNNFKKLEELISIRYPTTKIVF